MHDEYHVHLFQFALKKGVLDVHLMEVPPFRRGKCDHGPHSRHLCHRGKGLLVVNSMRLGVAFRYESRFVAVDGTVGIVLHFVNPLASDRLPVR